MFILIGCLFGIVAATIIIKHIAYNTSTYKKLTNNSYGAAMSDKGMSGEYGIYKYLKNYESVGCRFLFNLYLPRADGKTSELDVVLITGGCVFVFESKNYSGWIFGSENQKTWTQVLPTGSGRGRSQKTRFYNPVLQNRTHCEVLKKLLPPDTVVHSVVLFANRSTFKKVSVRSDDVSVAHHGDAAAVVSGFLNSGKTRPLDIEQIYSILYPYSQVSEETKRAHIYDASINNRFHQ
ncbi:MAG: NERD domain-containing protein [Clostridia bacterium]|nr:NERD domain-containing protein [Clostridia bacterium]